MLPNVALYCFLLLCMLLFIYFYYVYYLRLVRCIVNQCFTNKFDDMTDIKSNERPLEITSKVEVDHQKKHLGSVK